MNHRKLILFTSLAYGFTWLVLLGLQQFSTEETGFLSTFLTFLYRWGPAIAAILVARRMYGDPLTQLGLTSRDQIKGKWFFLGIAWAAFLLPFTVFITWLLSDILGTDFIGTLDFNSDRILAVMTPEGSSAENMPSYFQSMSGGMLLLVTALTQFLIGTSLFVAYTYGEELAWRGFLVQETKSLGFWKSNLFVGLVSGIWYAGVLFPEGEFQSDSILQFLTVFLFYLSVSFPLSYFARKSGTLLTPACMQGIIMALAGTFMVFVLTEEDTAWSGIIGFSGILCSCITAAILYLRDPDFLSGYRQPSFLILPEQKQPDHQ